MGGTAAEEFPLLNSLGLYAADIRGDGNCLFNALSDQLYGDQNQHAAIRSRVIEYMREHQNYYKQFIDVHPGGGYRRNPKRKNAGGYSSPANFVPPTEAEIDRVFENHLTNMAKGGTWGDNMEITAFSFAFDYNVQIYMRDFSYMISPVPGEEGTKPIAHIAYHVWEHYSSIRNLDGPHSGMPNVSPKALSPEEEQRQKEKLAQTPHVLPWMIDVVEKSLPFLADKMTIKRALEAAKGDVNLAVSNMLDAEENGSGSSQHESSSVERDHDSDDDMHDGPNKKQDRRMSRASRAQKKRDPDSKHALSQLTTFSGSQESFSSWESEASSQPDTSQRNTSMRPATTQDGDSITVKPTTNAASNGTLDAQPRPTAKPVRLKLLPPKPPDPSLRAGKTSQRQPGPRLTARDKKDMKKQAQKAARKERQQAGTKPASQGSTPVSIPIRKGATETPPVETLRTLYI